MANRKIGSLLVSVGADTKQLKEGLRDAEQQASKFGRTSSRVATRSRSSFANMAAVAGTAALSTVGAIAGAGLAGAAIVGRAIDGIPSVYKQMQGIRRQTDLARLGAEIDADPAAARAAYILNPANAMADIYHEFQMTVGRMLKDENSALRGIADSIEELVQEIIGILRAPEMVPAAFQAGMQGLGMDYLNRFGDLAPGQAPTPDTLNNVGMNPMSPFWR